MTNIASSLSLEQATTVFVFIMSVMVLGEQFVLSKALAVSVCILGVILVAVGDQLLSSVDGNSRAVLGDCLVLTSAAAAATYMVTYKKLLQDLPVSLSAVNAFLGTIGLCNVLFFWPGLVILSVAGVEEYNGFQGVIIVMSCSSACLALVFNYALNYGIILTSPLFMRVVIICGVPASFLVNTILEGLPETSWAVLLRVGGAAIVVVGFLWFTYEDYKLSQSIVSLQEEGEEEEGGKEKEREQA